MIEVALAAPTRRVQTLLAIGKPPADLVRQLGDPALAASLPASVRVEHLVTEGRHQADLASHPYLAEIHLLLAAARLSGAHEQWDAWRAALPEPWSPPRWRPWRPRGLRSAARRSGVTNLQRAHDAALRHESTRTW